MIKKDNGGVKLKEALFHTLKEHQVPISLQELEQEFKQNLAVKDAAWKLVEEGKAQFTQSWDLELCSN